MTHNLVRNSRSDIIFKCREITKLPKAVSEEQLPITEEKFCKTGSIAFQSIPRVRRQLARRSRG